jgi:ABC-type nitrate/sulfonate/bicarbonate transport system permease component
VLADTPRATTTTPLPDPQTGRERLSARLTLNPIHRHAQALLRAQAVIGLVGFAAVLELAPRVGLVSPRYLPPFSVIAVALADEVRQANFWAALAFTMRSWAIGLTISVVAGTGLGILIGSSAVLQAVTRSTIEFLRPIPSVALIPVAILLFGTTLQSNLVLVVYASFWQVLIQVLAGVQDVDPVARETAQSYRFGHWAMVRHVIWPTTLPYLMTGIRLAASVALILAITAELTIGTPGLGKELSLAQSGRRGRAHVCLSDRDGTDRRAGEHRGARSRAQRHALASFAARG